MSRIVFLESVAGVAGDMFSAAFLDAGLVSQKELESLPSQLGLSDVQIQIKRVDKATMRSTHLRVLVHGATTGQPVAQMHEDHSTGPEHESHFVIESTPGHAHKRFSDIDRLLAQSCLPPAVTDVARKIFRLIAEAEADAHGIDVQSVAFHEIGSLDSILDVVLAAYCIQKVQPARFYATPLRPGRGYINIAHGTHPVPPPASARLLVGLPTASTPSQIRRENIELSTPTGIAIIKVLEPTFVDELPPGIIKQQGMGAGTMDLEGFPNVFRIICLETPTPAADDTDYETDRVVELACNIDDDTAEHLAWISQRMLENGALDVSLTPAIGKKGRSVSILSVLSAESDWRAHADWLFRNSTTFGLRYRTWDRLKLARRFELRSASGEMVSHKIGLTKAGEILKLKPEFEEQRRIWETRNGTASPKDDRNGLP